MEPWKRAPIQENSELKRPPIQPKVADTKFPNQDCAETGASTDADEVGARLTERAEAAGAAAGTDAAKSLGTERTAGPDTAEIIARASFADRLSD